MDTNSTLIAVVLTATIALAVLVAASVAAISALSPGRIRSAHPNGPGLMLLRHVRGRQQLLRALSVATTAVMVVGTAAVSWVILGGRSASGALVLLAAVGSFLLLTFVGQTTRSIVLRDPEHWALRLGPSIRALRLGFAPLVWLANLPLNLILRLAGRSDALGEVDPVKELVGLLELSEPGEEPAVAEQRRMMRGVLDMSNQTVRELMTPRTDLVGVSTDASIGDAMRVISESGYSRIPLFSGSLDTIVGVVYAKDLLAYLRTGDVTPRLGDICRSAYFVPETKRADELLADLRRDHVHLAIVVDEYGGTAGVVSVEDLIEEIVGEISDEYDTGQVELVQITDGEAFVDARMTIDELNELFSASVQSDDFDTVGGLIFTLLGRLAMPGDEVVTLTSTGEDDPEGLRLRVLSVLGRRIKRVRVLRAASSAEPSEAAAV